MQHSLINTLDENKTVLLHGTSIEATIHLLETGIFDYKIGKRNTAPRYQNYLFFAPNGKYFEGNKIGVDTEICEWKNSLNWATLYAKGVADDHYIQTVAGFRPEHISELCEGWDEGVEKLLLPEFEQHGFNRKYLKNLLKETEKRKGVLLGFNEKIFEKNIEQGKDDPNLEVCMYLPKGITIEYLSGIQPLGPIETDILKNISINTALNNLIKIQSP
ncbi:MAG: hypothetical protein ACP5OA_05780 [Candidatus Woesearchaeota archaeon]